MNIWAASSVVERCPDKTEVIGSIPMPPTPNIHFLLTATRKTEVEGSIPSAPTLNPHLYMRDPKIIYEDKNFLAIDKPAGLLVHPVRSKNFESKEATLVDWLLAHYPQVKNVGDDPEFRPGIVHRLDRETSGIMLAALNQEYFLYLKSLFQERHIKKTYLALVEGDVFLKEGAIEKAIRIKKGTVKRTVYHGRNEKEAKTLYGVIKHLPGISLLEVTPLTGRTHQIRVHLQSIGHPICGDTLYAPKDKARKWDRLMLHAHSLEFIPEDGKAVRLEAETPPEFLKIIHTPDTGQGVNML